MGDDSFGGDSLEGIDLDLYSEIDHLVEEFRRLCGTTGALSAEEFAAAHPDVESALLPALRAVDTLRRSGSGGIDGPLHRGQTVGRFTVVGELGRGGMGVVYEASEEGLERTVALKVLDARFASDSFKARFLREARAAARLEHPSIVPVYGTGADGPLLWYAMRRIHGRALDSLMRAWADDGSPELRQRAERALLAAADVSSAAVSSSGSSAGRLAPGAPRHIAVARIGQKLSSALGYAHGEGVLHRDVKPGNVLLDREGAPHLTDFGLCKLEGDASLTEAADVIGTLRYMPPEALHMDTDARGDVYGLGLVLYELLARRPAFSRSERARLVDDIQRRDPTSLRKIDPTIPKDLVRIIAKATAKLPGERYQTGDAFSQDLTAFLTGKPIRARPLGVGYLLRLLVRRHRAAALVALVSVVVLVGAAVAYVVQLQRLVGDVTEAREEAERRETLAVLSSTGAEIDAGEIGAAQQQLRDTPDDQKRPGTRRGWAAQHLHGRSAMAGKALMSGVQRPRGYAQLATGDLAIFSRANIRVVDPVTLRRVNSVGAPLKGPLSTPLSEFTGAVPNFQDSAAGAGFIYALASPPLAGREDFEVGLWRGSRNDGLETVVELDARPQFLTSNEAAGIAACVAGRELLTFDLRTAEVAARCEVPHDLDVSTTTLTDAGDLVLGSRSGEVWRVDVASGESRRIARHTSSVDALLVRGDELLASGGADGVLNFYPETQPGQHRSHCRLTAGITCLHLDANGTLHVGLASGLIAHVDYEARVKHYEQPYFLSAVLGFYESRGESETKVWAVSVWGRLLAIVEGVEPGIVVAGSSLGYSNRSAASHDGEAMAFVAFDGWMRLVREERVVLSPAESRHAFTAFRSDDRFVAAGGLVLDATTGETCLRWASPGAYCLDSIWVENTLLLLVWSTPPGTAADQRRLDLWVWDSSRPSSEPRFHSTVVEGMPWYNLPIARHIAGTRDLVIGDSSGVVRRYRLDDAKASWVRSVIAGSIRFVAPDVVRGHVIVGGDHTGLRALDLRDGEDRDFAFGRMGSSALRGKRIADFDVHEESGKAATVDEEGRLRIWTYPEGEGLIGHSITADRAFSVNFTPDGDGVLASSSSGPVYWIGAGRTPAYARGRTGLARASDMVTSALELLGDSDVRAEDRVAACATAAFLGLDAEVDPDDHLGDEVLELHSGVRTWTSPGDLVRMLTARSEAQADTFGRFGWVPAGLNTQ